MAVGSYISRCPLTPWSDGNVEPFEEHENSRGKGELKYINEHAGLGCRRPINDGEKWDAEFPDGRTVQIKRLSNKGNEIRSGKDLPEKTAQIVGAIVPLLKELERFCDLGCFNGSSQDFLGYDIKEFLRKNRVGMFNMSYSSGALFGETSSNEVGLLQLLERVNLVRDQPGSGMREKIQSLDEDVMRLILEPRTLVELVSVPASQTFADRHMLALVHESGYWDIPISDVDDHLSFNRISEGKFCYKLDV